MPPSGTLFIVALGAAASTADCLRVRVETKMVDRLDVRTGYDRWAAVYDRDGNPLQALEEPLMRAALGMVGGETSTR